MIITAQTTDHTAGWQAGFLAVLPAVEIHAKIQFRHLPLERREDAIQEAIAAACVSYQLLAAQGRLHVAHPGTLATFAVKHVNSGRHVGGSQDAARDAVSPVAQARHGFKTASYDRFDDDSGGWRQLTLADRKHPIPDTAAFRIDFARWLRTLTRRDRRIVASLIVGDGTGAVASRFGITPGRVSQLRLEYERRWKVFQGEVVCDAA